HRAGDGVRAAGRGGRVRVRGCGRSGRIVDGGRRAGPADRHPLAPHPVHPATREGTDAVTAEAVGIGVAQFAPTTDRAANLRLIEDLVGRARDRGARVVLFPEYSSYFVNPFDESLAAHAEDIDGPFVQALTRI